MSDTTATPETGPVDASAVNDPMSEVLSELANDTPATDAIDEVVAELVKGPKDDGQPDEGPDAEESATEPTDEDEEPDDGTPDAEKPEDPAYMVKVNGEEQEVPLSELLKGYSRNEDYKSKTMALADDRRALETQRATVEADVKSQYANDLKQSIDLFEALDPVLSEARQIDWAELKRQDPATFVQYSDAVNERLQLVEQHRAKIAQIEQERTQTQTVKAQADAAQRMEIAANKIVEMMPELKEGDNFSRFATDNIGYLRETGFTPEEITDALDDRALMMADKARKWDALQAAKKGLPAHKIVPKSSVKPMTTDASDSSRAPSPRLSRNAGVDQRVDFVIKELMKG